MTIFPQYRHVLVVLDATNKSVQGRGRIILTQEIKVSRTNAYDLVDYGNNYIS